MLMVFGRVAVVMDPMAILRDVLVALVSQKPSLRWSKFSLVGLVNTKPIMIEYYRSQIMDEGCNKSIMDEGCNKLMGHNRFLSIWDVRSSEPEQVLWILFSLAHKTGNFCHRCQLFLTAIRSAFPSVPGMQGVASHVSINGEFRVSDTHRCHWNVVLNSTGGDPLKDAETKEREDARRLARKGRQVMTVKS
ncbi:hypothetical protein HYC85_003019 [Camellia sinensis]|uniref:Uncharacterized protein n=1 Tax=Camellia sinensis TaxID=4442 RepID=A0A7J7I9Z3_CAMSI|nr:hypothetical protein HYC85_003019 [Camellia sinensis]